MERFKAWRFVHLNLWLLLEADVPKLNMEQMCWQEKQKKKNPSLLL